MGGGTGLSVLLRGLKEFPLDITAVVTVSDDDSSTGRLRKEFNIPAIGDLRNVLVALSEVEPTLEKLLQYRFRTKSDLNGHPIGNLLITALLNIKGNLVDAISALGNILKLKGEVLPLTEDCVTLIAETADNKTLVGESNITKAGKKIKKIYYKEKPVIVPKVLEAINNADLIIFGSGSLYTSILPNILCDEMKEAIIKSPAKKMYICNIMTEHGETDGFKVSDYINVINEYIGKDILDVVIANNMEIDEKIKLRYKELEKSEPVLIDRENIKIKLIEDKLAFINEEAMVRHNHRKTALLIYSYLME